MYPLPLTQTIEMNWLCNPTGKSDGFCGVDWLVELNNLYTKVMTIILKKKKKTCQFVRLTTFQVIFCGTSSNQTLSHITNQSALIDIYQLVHINIDDNFGVTRRSTRHTPIDMRNTLKTL